MKLNKISKNKNKNKNKNKKKNKGGSGSEDLTFLNLSNIRNGIESTISTIGDNLSNTVRHFVGEQGGQEEEKKKEIEERLKNLEERKKKLEQKKKEKEKEKEKKSPPKKSPPKKSPPKRSPSKRSPSKLNTLEKIKHRINEIYYEIIDIVESRLRFINKNKPTTQLEIDLSNIYNMDPDNFMKSLEIIKIKKNTLEESLFIISSILRYNCDGYMLSLVCSTLAKLAKLENIYNLLKETESLKLPGVKTTKDKFKYISDCYKKNTNLQYIINIAKNSFNDKVMIQFITLAIPFLESIITLKKDDKIVYLEFQRFKEDFYNIKNSFEQLDKRGGKNKKNPKKNPKK